MPTYPPVPDRPCRYCGDPSTYHGPDPYWAMILGATAEVHLCGHCQQLRAELVEAQRNATPAERAAAVAKAARVPFFQCRDCGQPATYRGPDPYTSEVSGERAEVRLCDRCYSTRLDLVPDV